MPELALIEELARGENRFDLSRRYRTGQPFDARRVVHHRRDSPARYGPENYRRADPCVR
ncbi:hypothetical protein D3C85_1911560 [compost metagenome]